MAVDHHSLGLRYADEVRPVGDKVSIEILPRREIILQLNKALGERGSERFRFARIAGIGPRADTCGANVGDVVLVGIFCGEDVNGHGSDQPGWDQIWLSFPRADARIIRDKEIVALVEDYG